MKAPHRIAADPRLLSSALLLALACAGGEGPPTRAECEKATAHAIELRVANAEVPGANEEILRRHREQLAGAAGDSLTARCEQGFDRADVLCVTRATTAAALDACGPGAP